MKNLIMMLAAAMLFSAFGLESCMLPEGFVRVLCIEPPKDLVDGDISFIDTGYRPGTNTVIECLLEISMNQTNEVVCPFGTIRTDERRSVNVYVRRGQTPEVGIATGADVTYSTNCFRVGVCEWMSFDAGRGELSNAVGGSIIANALTNETESTLHVFGASPFARHKAGMCRMRLYALRIKESGWVVHDFVPCLPNNDMGVGLYDCVNGRFHPVVGPKAFVAGFSDCDALAYSSATDLLDRFKRCEVKPSEVLIAQMSRVVRYNGRYDNNRNYGNTNQYDYLNELDTFNAGKVNAVTFDKFTTALKEARDADEIYEKCRTNDHDAIAYVASHPLLGITVGMKDDFETKGWVKDGASLVMYAEGYVTNALLAKADDDVCERLRAAGAIFPFQTTVPEFCASCTTWSRVYGVTRNPWNLHYSVGGSSGGSGAALAAGFCTLATGTDMGGSIRIPAAMNGVYGFRPPFGRVPTTENAYCANGPMARTFPDLVLMQNVICGPSEKVHSTVAPKLEYPTSYESISNQTVAVCRLNTWLKGGLDATVNKSMDEVAKVLTKAGAKVIEIELPSARAETVATYAKGLLSTEIGMIAAYANAHSNLVCRYVTNAIKSFSNLGPSNVLDAATLMTTIHVEMQTNAFRKGCLAVVMPTLPTPFMPADLGASDDDSKKSLVNTNRIQDTEMLTTSLWNLASRFPVVNVPVTLSDSEFRLPIGVQVIGNVYADLDAFRVADTLSRELETKFYKTRGVYPDFREQIKTNAVKKISR